jgi:hypothetical protein
MKRLPDAKGLSHYDIIEGHSYNSDKLFFLKRVWEHGSPLFSRYDGEGQCQGCINHAEGIQGMDLLHEFQFSDASRPDSVFTNQTRC